MIKRRLILILVMLLWPPAYATPENPRPAVEHLKKSKKRGPKRTCRYVMNRFANMVRKFVELSETSSTPLHHQQPWHKLLDASFLSCFSKKEARQLLGVAAQIRAEHNHKIGIMIPYKLFEKKLVDSFIHGASSACQEDPICVESQHLVLKRYHHHSRADLEKVAAELLYHHGVTLIVGGFHPPTHEFLNELATIFSLPVFLMAPRAHHDGLSRHTFLFSPSEKHLLARLLSFFKSQNKHKIVLLEPAGGVTQGFLSSMLDTYNMTMETHTYHKSYPSMLNVAKEVLELHPHQRKDEWDQLVAQKRAESEELGEELKIEDVFLEPRFQHDVLLIADNAKMVRHYVKIFRYLRLKKPIPLAGMHLWRAEDLLKPWDNLLEGAYFADFIGLYNALPSFVKPLDRPAKVVLASGEAVVKKPEEPGDFALSGGYFIDPAQMASIDFQLLGYRAINQALSLALTPGIKRTHMTGHLQNLVRQNQLGSMKTLSTVNEVYWPIHLFKITRGQLRHLPQGPTQ